MLRGEFIRGDGLVLPNNITTYGARSLLQWALTNVGYSLHLALVNCNPSPDLLVEDLNEPTLAVNGYNRIQLVRATDWPVFGELSGESYFETATKIFTAAGGDFDSAISRCALVNHASAITGDFVVALGSPLAAPFVITPTTPAPERSFKYRVYLR